MSVMATFTLYLPDHVLERVDAARGEGSGKITRSGAIRIFIEEGLERQGQPRPPVRSPEPKPELEEPRDPSPPKRYSDLPMRERLAIIEKEKRS